LRSCRRWQSSEAGMGGRRAACSVQDFCSVSQPPCSQRISSARPSRRTARAGTRPSQGQSRSRSASCSSPSRGERGAFPSRWSSPASRGPRHCSRGSGASGPHCVLDRRPPWRGRRQAADHYRPRRNDDRRCRSGFRRGGRVGRALRADRDPAGVAPGRGLPRRREAGRPMDGERGKWLAANERRLTFLMTLVFGVLLAGDGLIRLL
jgi:hypothetical protein